MIIATIFVLVCIECIAWKMYKDIKSPAFMHGILWIIALANLRTMSIGNNVTDTALLIVGCGALIFQFGFSTGTHIKIDKREYTITANNRAMKWLIAILIVVAIPVIYQYVGFIRGYSEPLYSAIRQAESSLNLPALFDYYRKITQFLFLCFVTVYWTEPIESRKGIRPYVLALFIIATLAAASVPTRNSILFYALPLVMIWFCTHRTSNKKMVVILLGAAVGFLLIFYIISTGKYWYMYAANGANRKSIISSEIQTYLSGGIVAFSDTIFSHSFTRNGADTFRLFIAIGDALFGLHNAVPLVNEFITIGNGITTNVYTFYDFYIRDFGIIYALMMQYVVAVIHGVSYNKMKKGNLFSIFIFSMLSYPLLMQFFQDQYFSLLSTWVQIFIVGAVVLKSGLFFRKNYTK